MKPLSLTGLFSGMNRIFTGKSRGYITATGILWVLILGVIDLLTGYELAFSIFYSFPVLYVGWYTDRARGVFLSFFSALVWETADHLSGHTYSHLLIPVWNTLMRLFTFLIIAYLTGLLKKVLDQEKRLAREDPLTRVANSRYFLETGQKEIARARRHGQPLTVLYMDLDNFKKVNDSGGHKEGDRLLSTLAAAIRNNIRITDLAARLGGDEFGVLLPETDASQARQAVEKLRKALDKAVAGERWPVTVSLGAVTCSRSRCDLETILQAADKLMYEVKRAGKNGVKFAEI